MNDDELTRLFRSLDEPAEPRAAFADGLLADLERLTSGATIRRRTSVRWLLVAATLLLVVSLGAALAVGSGLVKLPLVLVVASATPEPSATPPGSGTPAPSQSASTTPTPVPVIIPEPTSIDRLVAIPDGFLAIGWAPSPGSGGSVSVILRGSSDGATWQSMDTSQFGKVIDVAVGPLGWVLVANTDPALNGPYVVWRSADGQSWTANDQWTSDKSPQPRGVVAGPAGFAISGSYNTGAGEASTVWTSTDGTRWTRAATTTCPSNFSCGWVDHAVVLDKGFIAYESGVDGTDVHVFASLDGATWESISSPTGSGHSVIAGLLQVGQGFRRSVKLRRWIPYAS